MVFVEFLESKKGIEEILETLKKENQKAIVIAPELALLQELLDYTYFLTYKSFQEETNSAKKFELEWMKKISCKKNISEAIEFCQPKEKTIAIASEKKISEKTLSLIGEKTLFKKTPETQKKLAQMYEIKPALLSKYPLEKLLIEKTAINGI